MGRTLALLAAPVAVLALTASSCAPQDPCRNVETADPALVQAAADHPDIEIEAVGEYEAECILTRDGRWAEERDSE